MSRRQYHLQPRTFLIEDLDKSKPVQATGHPHVRQYEIDAGGTLKNGKRLLHVGRFQYGKSSAAQLIGHHQPHQDFVLDHKYPVRAGSRFRLQYSVQGGPREVD